MRKNSNSVFRDGTGQNFLDQPGLLRHTRPARAHGKKLKPIAGMTNLFKWWVKFKVVDRKKKNGGPR